MGRKQKKCTKKCDKHLFHLRPFHSMAYLSRDVHISFCPPTLEKSPNYPTFNRDMKHYTSSFCLKDDMSKYETNDAYYKTEHDKFCEQQQRGKTQLLIPKPRSKNQYCYVCKIHYEDYYQHVKLASHKINIRKNKFTQYTQALIEARYPKNPVRTITQESSVDYEKIEIFSADFIRTSSLKTSETVEPKNVGENNYFGSFKTLNSQGALEFRQLIRKETNGHHLPSLEIIENKIVATPQNELMKKKTTECDEKKSPMSTKFHSPIILNSPLVIQ